VYIISYTDLEWEKWNGPVLRKRSTKKSGAELEESTTVIGDAAIRGSYLEEDEGMLNFLKFDIISHHYFRLL